MTRERRTQAVALALLGGVAAAAFGLRGKPAPVLAGTEPAAPARPLPRVSVVTPERRTIRRVVRVPADVLAFDDATVFARATGYVREVPVDIGSRVARGDVLAVLDVPDLDAAAEAARGVLARAAAGVEESKAAFAIAETGVTLAEAEGEQARSEVGRAEAEQELRAAMRERLETSLRSSPNLVSRDAVDEARAQARIADARLDQAGAAVRVADAKHEAAKARLGGARAAVASAEAAGKAAKGALAQAEVAAGFATLRAPFAGVVTERWVDPGDLVKNGTAGGSPVLRVVDLSKVRVRLRVAEPDAPAVAPGRAFRLLVDELPGRDFRGTVARVAGALDLETRTMVVEGDLENRDGALRHGMFGRVSVDLEEHPEALVLPAAAVTTARRKSSVLVVEGGKVAKRPIRIGVDDGIVVEVLEGLKGEESVITAGAGLVADGDAVEAVPAEPGR